MVVKIDIVAQIQDLELRLAALKDCLAIVNSSSKLLSSYESFQRRTSVRNRCVCETQQQLASLLEDRAVLGKQMKTLRSMPAPSTLLVAETQRKLRDLEIREVALHSLLDETAAAERRHESIPQQIEAKLGPLSAMLAVLGIGSGAIVTPDSFSPLTEKLNNAIANTQLNLQDLHAARKAKLRTIPASALYDQDTFWSRFMSDLLHAKRRAVIVSPFVALARTGYLVETFKKLNNHGVAIDIACRPPARQNDYDLSALEMLERAGAQLHFRDGIHQKIAVIDDAIAWEGSLNILQHKSSVEQMRRFESTEIAHELMSTFFGG